jgi:Ala-tRNA(Pro) deacylase
MGVTMGALERLRRHLYETQVSYRVREHREAYTTQEIAALEHVAGRRMIKVVMAVAGGRLVMLVLAAPDQVDLSRVAVLLSDREVRLAHEEEFTTAFPDCDPGAMPPFGNLYGLPVYVDDALATSGSVVFQAGTHRHTIELPYADFQRLVEPVVASLSRSKPPPAMA